MHRWQVLAYQPTEFGVISLHLLMQFYLPMLQYFYMHLFILFCFKFWNKFIIYFCDNHLSRKHRDLHSLTKLITHAIHQRHFIFYPVLLHSLTVMEFSFLQTRHTYFFGSSARFNFHFYFIFFFMILLSLLFVLTWFNSPYRCNPKMNLSVYLYLFIIYVE